MSLEIHGGKPVALTVDNFRKQSTSGDFIKSQYAEWAASVVSQPTMIGNTDGGLVPIWEIAGLSPGRAAQLKAEVDRYTVECARGVTDRPLNNLGAPIMNICRIRLQKEGGVWMGSLYDGSDWFPTRQNTGMEINLYRVNSHPGQPGNEPIVSGEHVNLALVGGGSGNEIWLTVQSGNDAYVGENRWHPKAKWHIWVKGSDGKPIANSLRRVIRTGDYVALENADYARRYLGPDGDYWDIQGTDELHWFQITRIP